MVGLVHCVTQVEKAIRALKPLNTPELKKY